MAQAVALLRRQPAPRNFLVLQPSWRMRLSNQVPRRCGGLYACSPLCRSLPLLRWDMLERMALCLWLLTSRTWSSPSEAAQGMNMPTCAGRVRVPVPLPGPPKPASAACLVANLRRDTYCYGFDVKPPHLCGPQVVLSEALPHG